MKYLCLLVVLLMPWMGFTATIQPPQSEIPGIAGSPNGVVKAPVGYLYRDVQNGVLYIKTTPETSNTGWVPNNTSLSGPGYDEFDTNHFEIEIIGVGDSITHIIHINTNTFPVGGGGGGSDSNWTNVAGVVKLVTATNRIDLGDGTGSGLPDYAHVGGSFSIPASTTRGMYWSADISSATNPLSFAAFEFQNESSGSNGYVDPWNVYIHGAALGTNETYNIFNFDYGSFQLVVDTDANNQSGLSPTGMSGAILAASYSDARASYTIAGFNESNGDGQTNVAVAFRTHVNNRTGPKVGGAFFLSNLSSRGFEYESAALLTDNGDTGLPALIARTDGDPKFTIDGVGQANFTGLIDVENKITGDGDSGVFISTEWDDGGEGGIMTGLGITILDTSSAANSTPIDVSVDATRIFTHSKNGNLNVAGSITSNLDRGLQLASQTSAAAAQAATLLNAPVAGNPAFWLKVKVNGVDRSIPCW